LEIQSVARVRVCEFVSLVRPQNSEIVKFDASENSRSAEVSNVPQDAVMGPP